MKHYLGFTLLLAGAVSVSRSGATQSTTASPHSVPTLAVVLTPPEGDAGPRRLTSTLHWFTEKERTPTAAPARASVTHWSGSSVRARVLPTSNTVIVTVKEQRRGDYDTALFRLESHRQPVRLCGSLAHASTPLVTKDGRIYVSRGVAGPLPAFRGHYRIDELSIERVDPASGATATTFRDRGFLLHLAGLYQPVGGSEQLVVYRVGPQGASLLGVDTVTGRARPILASMAPFARDFSIDSSRHRLVYRQRAPRMNGSASAHQWLVASLDLRDGSKQMLLKGNTFSVAPSLWPDGRIIANPSRRGPRFLPSRQPLAVPWKAGVDVVRATDKSGRFVALTHTDGPTLPTVYIYDDKQSTVRWSWQPRHHRIAVAGFISDASDRGAR